MLNFEYHNPVRIVFGKGSIEKLARLVPDGRVLMTYGGGSIRRNGVYDQVMDALKGREVIEFGGIEPNPTYETCMRAVEITKKESVAFLLAVGGGSVIDGTKFIAAASRYTGGDPWEILSMHAEVREAVPLGVVLTLPATGSEMNTFAVISRSETREKLPFSSPHVAPRFSILDPETTFSLPERYLRNGIVDAFVHVMEQFATYDVDTPLQDRLAVSIAETLVEIAPMVFSNPPDYNTRATFMWCATQALNGSISCGVVQDWSTHMIGHELTAFFGLDHGESLAVVLPGVWRHQIQEKSEKLALLGKRIWGISGVSARDAADRCIEATEGFFRSLGMKTRLGEYGIEGNEIDMVVDRFRERGTVLGERQDIGPGEIREILLSRL